MGTNEINEYEEYMKGRPHLVLLGAGASIAAVPNGDKNGLNTSVMWGFIDKLEMRDIIDSVNLKTTSENLEDIYSELDSRPDCNEVKSILEERIRNYFSTFVIPDEPTVYDYLILSLREKDCIATFNWDPLLLQAYQRARKITLKLPELLFLHGNVAVGTCEEHKCGGAIMNKCPVCNSYFEPTRLLYPVAQKDYNSDLFIRDAWNAVKRYMECAYMVTIFGYSAPKTDKEAIDLLKEGWGSINERKLEEIEFIDIRDEDELIESWQEFIHTHHYSVNDNFHDTTLGLFPRRSCDVTFDRLMNNKWLDGSKGIKQGMNFHELKEYFEILLEQEENYTGVFSID